MNAHAVRAVLFDLDDTLFPQGSWLDGAWRHVAAAGARRGLPGEPLRSALIQAAAEGTDRGGIIDRALAAVGGERELLHELVDAFRTYAPASLPSFQGVPGALARLRSLVPIALVTDGDVGIQTEKLQALGLSDAFDVVVLSDELGRARRKPHPAPFMAALERLGTPPSAAVFVGDRPDKDVAGATNVGMRAVRVRTGEYADAPDTTTPWASASDVIEAIALLEQTLSVVPADPGSGATSGAARVPAACPLDLVEPAIDTRGRA